MAESHLMRQPVVDPSLPDGKKKPEITAEQIAKHIEELRGYLRDWEIRPDSFLQKEDYGQRPIPPGLSTVALIDFLKKQREEDPELEKRLQKLRKNKLMTAWFTVLPRMRQIIAQTQLQLSDLELDALDAELRQIKKQEETAVNEFIEERGIKLPADNLAASDVIKKIKKEVAPALLGRKIQLIRRVEKSIELLLAKLEEILCQVTN